MDNEVLTTVTFEENCEYESSVATRKVPIPQQTVLITLDDPINTEINRLKNDGTYVFYYDDKIQLQARVFQQYYDDNNVLKETDIQVGRIEFYFIPEGADNAQLINYPSTDPTSGEKVQTCELNQNGTAAVQFKPKSSGKVFAKYIDDNDFYTAITPINIEGKSIEKSLILEEVPVNIEFVEVPPYITYVHDEVNNEQEEVRIKVHVTNAKDGSDIRYGTVTFAHYLKKEDYSDPNTRVPKIIGNPVPVFNGYAEISYIPVQSDDYGYTNSNNDTEPEILIENNQIRYVEYIRASYNYSGKYVTGEKGAYKWKYYATASKWTGINVLARNTININAPQIGNTTLSLNGETGIYQCSENDTITISAILKDKNNQTINFGTHSGILTFHIKGVHAHPKTNHIQGAVPLIYSDDYEQTTSEFNFLQYKKDIDATYVKGTNGQNDKFTAQIIKPLPGFYSITATTTIQTDEGQVLINYGVNESVENDKKYVEVNDSNIIYISSNYIDTQYQINLQHDTYTQTQEPFNNIEGNVIGLSNNQMSILNNQRCYFYVPKLNKTYTGKLSYNSNSNTLVGKLAQDENIIFTAPDNYQIYMYIPDGVYTNNQSVSAYHHNITSSSADSVYDFFLPFVFSNAITIQARDTIELSLNIPTTEDILPATFSYTLTSNYVSHQENAQLIKRLITQSSTKTIETITLTKEHNIHTGLIEIDTAGEYEIYAQCGNSISNKINIVVEKDMLEQTLLESSKTIFASDNETIGVYLNSRKDNINKIDINKIHAFLYSDLNNKQSVPIQNTRIIDNKTIYLTIRPGIWKEESWYIQITYDGDNNFSAYEGVLESFNTVLDDFDIQLIPYNNNYNIKINSSRQSNDVLIIPVIFNQHNTEVGKGVFITDENQNGSFYDITDNHNTLSWWNNWDNVVFIVNPYDRTLIDLLSNELEPYNALKATHNYVFDSHEPRVTETSKLNLQLLQHQNKYIYGIYRPKQIRVARPTSL